MAVAKQAVESTKIGYKGTSNNSFNIDSCLSSS